MKNILLKKKHLKGYVLYGSASGIFHMPAVWYFLHESNYHAAPILFIAPIVFTLVIIVYSIKLTIRWPDDKSIWGMPIFGQMPVFVGVVSSVICSFKLCWFYMPGFINDGGTDDFLRNAPVALL